MSTASKCWFHRWAVVDNWILPSAVEQLADAEFSANKLKGGAWMFEKPCIVTYRCSHCGTEKVKRV